MLWRIFKLWTGYIFCADPDEVASETLLFMLVGLRTYWKYAVGYVLCDKTNADNLYSRVLQVFRLASRLAI